MSRTVKQHFEDCKQVEEVIESANALLKKTRDELVTARSVLESLKEYQHPKLSMQAPYHLRGGRDEKTTPASLIQTQISRINALLGDKA